MNYAEARQLSDGSGWHFTVMNDSRIWTAPCCRSPGPPATEEDMEKYGYKLGEPTIGKAHDPHPTQQEAEDCFKQWRLRQPVSLDAKFGNWAGCEAVVDGLGERTYKRCDN